MLFAPGTARKPTDQTDQNAKLLEDFARLMAANQLLFFQVQNEQKQTRKLVEEVLSQMKKNDPGENTKASEEIMDKANEIMARDKINFSEALVKVQNEYPQMTNRYLVEIGYSQPGTPSFADATSIKPKIGIQEFEKKVHNLTLEIMEKNHSAYSEARLLAISEVSNSFSL